MLVRRVKSDFGRTILNPKNKVIEDDDFFDHSEDTITIQDQLESINVKIQLRELYNRVLKDELEESKSGASSLLKSLSIETKKLREQLNEALRAQKIAVQKALRSHREFQLALSRRPADFAIPWLDDKLFQISKKLNIYYYSYKLKRKQLDDAEAVVDLIEKWPRPGTLKWEIDAINCFHNFESRIEKMKVKLETARILEIKYLEIEETLRRENCTFIPILRNIEEQLKVFQKELAEIEKTLSDAIIFRDAAYRNSVITQKEALENRKRRRQQMSKMKAAVNRILDAASASHQNQERGIVAKKDMFKANSVERDSGGSGSRNHLMTEDVVHEKIAEVEIYQDRARKLVETMRVPNLTFIPQRFKNVMSLGEKLRMEIYAKGDLRDTLLHKKDQLLILLAHFNYSGFSIQHEFEERIKKYQNGIEISAKEAEKLQHSLDKNGEVIVGIRLASIRLLEQIDHHANKVHMIKSEPSQNLNLLKEKLEKLVETDKGLKECLKDHDPLRNYANYIKPKQVEPKLVRVASSGFIGFQSEDSDDGEEVIESKVPNRMDIKARSKRFIHSAKLKRGQRY